jgi:thymidylate kinase
VHQAYRTMAAREPERFAVIDGAQTIEQVEAAVWAAVAPLLVESRR